ncbi:FAD-dependent oxidoreductase [Fundicoccus culcitae]|uniref:FAD-dependent oxidoreductase n=1 Tax=Fundicoccus culcitae TaxID=2969821 RepID=A0ABY5P5A6_9LACT|nr:FAD-dependent oxidoreductase [Fundicoccus culcitae]UUX33891.1 FAD-dependent oxidoreductase [Fundicoccus culcitae]
MKIVIIGASFAGVSAAIESRKLYPDAEIILIEAQDKIGYIPSGLNMLLNGDLPSLDESFFVKEDYLYEQNIQLQLGTRVISLFANEKKLITAHMRYQRSVSYDVLILAMGSRQADNLSKSLNSTQIITTKDYVSSAHARRVVESAQNLAIIGGGQIAIETTDALVSVNKQVTIIEMRDQLLHNYFDANFVKDIQSIIEFTATEVYLNEKVTSIEVNPLKITTDKQELYPDAILLATSLIPNSELVKDIVELNDNGTIKVDEYLETSVQDIFAVGDLIQTPFGQGQHQEFVALINNAVRSGQIAALNLKEKRVKQSHSVRVMGTKVFNHYISSVGYTYQQAQKLYDPLEITVQVPYTLDDDTPVVLKLVVEKESGLILGAQFRSRADILSYTNFMALAIQDGLSDVDLAFRDRLYYPREISLNTVIYDAALACYRKRAFPHLFPETVDSQEEIIEETIKTAFNAKNHMDKSPVPMTSTVSEFKLPKKFD